MDIVSKSIDYEEHQLHYYVMGAGPRSLFAFHGFADHAKLFEPLAKSLAQEFTIIALDLPFHGQTQWASHLFKPKDIIACVELIRAAESIDKFSMMGHSMGGRMILALTPHFKTEIEELIMLAPAGFQGTISDSLILFPKFFRKLLKSFTSRKKLTLKIFDFGKRMGIINRGLHKFTTAMIEKEEYRQRMFDCWISLYHFPIRLSAFRKLLQKEDIPITFFYGKRDYITPAKYGRKFLERLPKGNLIMVEDNHFFLREPLAGALKQWLGGISSVRD
jgi:pimeloyl-ACP methyl ester carboxylesterase